MSVLDSGRGQDGKQRPLKELGKINPGFYFGELALIKNQLRTANVVAHTDLKVGTVLI